MIRDTSAQDRPVSVPQSRLRGRLVIGVAVAAALAVSGIALASFLGSDRSADAARLRIAQVQRGTLVRDAAVTGRVVAATSPTLYAPYAGTVTLKIAAGDTVEQGQVLAELDSPELTNEYDRERATLEQLEAEVARQRILASKQKLLARRTADEAALALQAAERDLQRTKQAFDRGAMSEIEFLRAQDARKRADILAQHAAADSGLEGQSVDFDLQTREKTLQRQRLVTANLERRIDELKVRAPVPGIVGTLSIADRAVVAANTALMTVVDLSRLEVELAVPESYAEDLGIGMNVQVRIGAVDRVGRVSAISPEVVERQVLARVRFDGEQPAGLRQNQQMTARILFEEKPDVLVLQRGPFVEAHGARYAYVLDGDDVAERRAIRIGATSVDSVEVLEGLAPGDRVVIAGSDTFADAERVSVN